MTKDLPSPELLRKLLRYEPETGKLFWLPRPAKMFSDQRSFNAWNARYADKEALTALDGQGYNTGSIYGKKYNAHRVIWAMAHNAWPVGDIDHINGMRTDNRLINLRNVSRSMNRRNAKMQSNNTSGHNGVSWYAGTGKWRADIRIDRVQKYLGSFPNIADAIAARKAAEADHGFTERHGQ